MKTRSMAILTVLAVAGLFSVANAAPTVQWLTGDDITTYVPQDTTLGDYHYIELEIPAGISAATLLQATLEIYLDVDVRTVEVAVGEATVEYQDPAPVLQVYPLTDEWSGSVDEESLDQDMGERQTVRLGNGRLVKIDITRIVKSFLENPSGNYGLLLGALTKNRSGWFSIGDEFGGGNKAKVTYYK